MARALNLLVVTVVAIVTFGGMAIGAFYYGALLIQTGTFLHSRPELLPIYLLFAACVGFGPMVALCGLIGDACKWLWRLSDPKKQTQ